MPATSTTYQTAKWLTHYMRLAFRFSKLVMEFEISKGDSFEIKVPKLLQAFRAAGVALFWEEECLAECYSLNINLGGWEACLESEIESFLKSMGWNIQTRYMHAIQVDLKADFVVMRVWDLEMNEIRAVYVVVKGWWHLMISALLDMSQKYKIQVLHWLLITSVTPFNLPT
ncbi:hypothetical protein DFJ43DRAFT_1040986 [Lentinula guzmanii]|uniref:Uncharacterized protein n=1 Tax=Lentinula guzmanii TaxID=2804957 RepID=A0AA38MY41_9AGAR|nr:hypothetical protein DFJ43DRAFT_1040986 [Lentinula guzmanii]